MQIPTTVAVFAPNLLGTDEGKFSVATKTSAEEADTMGRIAAFLYGIIAYLIS